MDCRKSGRWELSNWLDGGGGTGWMMMSNDALKIVCNLRVAWKNAEGENTPRLAPSLISLDMRQAMNWEWVWGKGAAAEGKNICPMGQCQLIEPWPVILQVLLGSVICDLVGPQRVRVAEIPR